MSEPGGGERSKSRQNAPPWNGNVIRHLTIESSRRAPSSVSAAVDAGPRRASIARALARRPMAAAALAAARDWSIAGGVRTGGGDWSSGGGARRKRVTRAMPPPPAALGRLRRHSAASGRRLPSAYYYFQAHAGHLLTDFQ